MTEYRPGVCNIDRRGRRRRLVYAAGGFAAAAVYVVVVAVADVPSLLVAGAFVPLAVGFEWAQQAYTAFCVRLALAGRHDADGGVEPAEDPGALREDRVQAAKITAAAVALAAATTGLIVVAL